MSSRGAWELDKAGTEGKVDGIMAMGRLTV